MTTQHDERAELIRRLRAAAKTVPCFDVHLFEEAADLLAADAQAGGEAVDMVLYCPKCHTQHIDKPEPGKLISGGPNAGRVRPGWDNPPHKSHLCHGCGHIWRPSDTPTNGVERTASGKDADTHPQPQAVVQGWKLVPVEPTPEMISAGEAAATTAVDEWSQHDHNVDPKQVIAAYRAMLSASPAVPAAAQVAQTLTDWDFITAHNSASQAGFLAGTSNWAYHMRRVLFHGIGKDQA